MRHWRPPPGVPCTQAATSDRPPTKKHAALPLGSFINSTAVAGRRRRRARRAQARWGGGRAHTRPHGEGERADEEADSDGSYEAASVSNSSLLLSPSLLIWLSLVAGVRPTCRLPRAGGEKEAALCSRLPAPAPALDLASRARFRTREGERGCSDFPTRARGRLHSLGRPRMCTARPCVAPHRAVVAATLVTRRRERACVTCFAAFAFAKGTSQSCGLKKSEGMRSK